MASTPSMAESAVVAASRQLANTTSTGSMVALETAAALPTYRGIARLCPSPDLVNGGDGREAAVAGEGLVGAEDLGLVAVAEKGPGLFAGDFSHSVDKQHPATAFGGLGSAQDDDDGFHRGVVEEPRAEADDGFEQVRLNQSLTQDFFFTAEEHSMGKRIAARPSLGLRLLAMCWKKA